MSRRAADLAQQTEHRERAALFETPPALWEAFFGNASEAKGRAETLQRSNVREVQYGAALALAVSGDSFLAQGLANDLEKLYPDDTSVKFSYVPTVRAVLALNQGEPAKAVEFLQVATPYELGAPRSSLQGFFGALYPVYIRGQAYLAERRGAEAAAEFQKILAHPGIVISDPIGGLARLQLGRAYALEAESSQGADADAARAKSRTAYKDFITLWKYADPDVPVLMQAKAEYSKLQ
jgi:hypothetical protein